MYLVMTNLHPYGVGSLVDLFRFGVQSSSVTSIYTAASCQSSQMTNYY